MSLLPLPSLGLVGTNTFLYPHGFFEFLTYRDLLSRDLLLSILSV
jgi:hypothetical protein